MMVMCALSDIKGCDRRRLELSITALHIKQDTTSIENFKVLRLDLLLLCIIDSFLFAIFAIWASLAGSRGCLCFKKG